MEGSEFIFFAVPRDVAYGRSFSERGILYDLWLSRKVSAGQ